MPGSELTQLPDVLSAAWNMLVRGAADRRHAFHHPAVATIGLDGRLRNRTVILRAADRTAGTIRFHTDARSSKCDQLAANPSICCCFYDETARVQVLVTGRATLHRADSIAAAAWEKSQPMSRVCYSTAPGPGAVIADQHAFSLPSDDTSVSAGYENFVAVVIAVEQIEWLFLKQAAQYRALFDLLTGQSDWLVP
jgi:pyridoxamine 5'-phosphate oxidase